jgi:hypothetical protein
MLPIEKEERSEANHVKLKRNSSETQQFVTILLAIVSREPFCTQTILG